MKLDSELGRLTLDQGSVQGPPPESERIDDRPRKEPARKVCGHGACQKDLPTQLLRISTANLRK